MREIKTCPENKWDQMSTEALDSILQAELEKDDPNEKVVLSILHIIEDREKDFLPENSAEVSKVRNKLSEHSTFPTKRRSSKGWIAGIAAVAAAACLVIMAIPKTVGAESLFEVLFRWTSSIFEFVDPDESGSKPQTPDAFVTDHPGLQQLHDKMVELGATENVVPMWLPEGFELVKLQASLSGDGHKVNAVFKKDDFVISISYRIPSQATLAFEKEDAGLEVFECADIEHYILENTSNFNAIWKNTDVECSLNTNLNKEEVYKIVRSIYRSELS